MKLRNSDYEGVLVEPPRQLTRSAVRAADIVTGAAGLEDERVRIRR
ncbi:MAG: hypothetical protein ACR2RB_06370 [Gammaproteobacteria bacterium]